MPSDRRYAAVAARAGHRCEYCLAPEVLFNAPFEVEHIDPRARGGRTEFDNLALACRSCNSHKGDMVSSRDPATGRTERFFHPRHDSWDDHFAIDLITGMIVGRTAVGRATAGRLGMNTARAVRARLLWLALSLYP